MNAARSMIPAPGSSQGLAAEASKLAPWFHNLHLPDGSQTAPDHPLGDFPRIKWEMISSHLPEDLSGWAVLDVGCNAGFYTIELARRGASVTGIDTDPHFLRQAKWAAQRWEMLDRIHFRKATVYDIGRWIGVFDLVLFMGVFHRLRYPLLALDILAEKTRQMMIFQTLSLPGEETAKTPSDRDIDNRDSLLEPAWPKMAFIEKSLAGDPTNWWVPNHAGIVAMLRSCGMAVASRPGDEIYLCTPTHPVHPDVIERNAAEIDSATGRPSVGPSGGSR